VLGVLSDWGKDQGFGEGEVDGGGAGVEVGQLFVWEKLVKKGGINSYTSK